MYIVNNAEIWGLGAEGCGFGPRRPAAGRRT